MRSLLGRRKERPEKRDYGERKASGGEMENCLLRGERLEEKVWDKLGGKKGHRVEEETRRRMKDGIRSVEKRSGGVFGGGNSKCA